MKDYDERKRELVRSTVREYSDNGDDLEDSVHEIADGLVDVYNAELTAWLASDFRAVYHVNDAIEELGWPGDLFKAIQYGQYEYYSEMVREEIEALRAEMEDA